VESGQQARLGPPGFRMDAEMPPGSLSIGQIIILFIEE
jgi:hypothetical protein